MTPPYESSQPALAQPGTQWFNRVRGVFVPPLPAFVPGNTLDIQEYVFTMLIRMGTALGTLRLLVLLVFGFPTMTAQALVLRSGIVLLIGLVGWRRSIAYNHRVAVVLVGVYASYLAEALFSGYSITLPFLCVLFALFCGLFLRPRYTLLSLVVSVATFALPSVLVALRTPVSPALLVSAIPVPMLISTSLLMVLAIFSAQIAGRTLFTHLDTARKYEHTMRIHLQHERDTLEERVEQRTSQLALARDQAVAAQQDALDQNAYLNTLHQITLRLLAQHDLADVLNHLVDAATTTLNAPFGTLMIEDDDVLVVRAFSANQPFVPYERVGREQAALCWLTYDTRRPQTIEDHGSWARERAVYAPATMYAVADFPIMVGERCIGVLALGRDAPDQPFDARDIERGTLFSQLAALAFENARLYTTTRQEIQERRKAEQLLQKQNAELQAFSSTVAHDLKTPLGSIYGYAQLLQSLPAQLDQRAKHMIAHIVAGSEKMSATIDALLLLASVRGVKTVQIAPLATDAIVGRVLLRLMDQVRSSGAEIHLPDGWLAAHGYAPRVEEIWANYISNALKYGGTPPSITLGSDATDDGMVRFWVKDNGPGLSAEEQALVFTEFTRLHSDRAEGHGLGLSIVRRITERLGGTVGVISVPGQGAQFFFTLPATDRTSKTFPARNDHDEI